MTRFCFWILSGILQLLRYWLGVGTLARRLDGHHFLYSTTMKVTTVSR